MKIAARILIAAGLILTAASALQAQSGPLGPITNRPQTYTVKLNSSVPGANVYVDGVSAGIAGSGGPLSVTLAAGRHDIRFSATGFNDWTRRIDVASDLTVDAQLVPAAGSNVYSVMVSSNVDGAAVFVDSYQLLSGAPVRVSLTGGSHAFRVSLPGYQDWNSTIDISSDTTVRAELKPANYRFTVVATVPRAQLTLSRIGDQSPPFTKLESGVTPYETSLAGGSYILTVTADGYLPYTTTVTVAGDVTVNAIMVPSEATIELVVPERFRDPYDRNWVSRIEWYVDGQKYTGGNGATIRVTAGAHDIRLVAGGLSISGRYMLQAGQTYRLEPTLQLELRP